MTNLCGKTKEIFDRYFNENDEPGQYKMIFLEKEDETLFSTMITESGCLYTTKNEFATILRLCESTTNV